MMAEKTLKAYEFSDIFWFDKLSKLSAYNFTTLNFLPYVCAQKAYSMRFSVAPIALRYVIWSQSTPIKSQNSQVVSSETYTTLNAPLHKSISLVLVSIQTPVYRAIYKPQSVNYKEFLHFEKRNVMLTLNLAMTKCYPKQSKLTKCTLSWKKNSLQRGGG